MENMEKKHHIDKVIYIVLFSVIVLLSIFLVWSLYTNDLYKEYESPINEFCYQVDYDDRSVTVTKYYKDGSMLSQAEKAIFENGKLVTYQYEETYKTKDLAKKACKEELKSNPTVKRTGNNVIQYEKQAKMFEAYDEESAEIIEKLQSFTNNKEAIEFTLTRGEEVNFGLADDWRRIK